MSDMFPGMDMDCLPTQEQLDYLDARDWAVSIRENGEGKRIFTFSKDIPEEDLNKFLSLSEEFKKQLRISDTYYIEK